MLRGMRGLGAALSLAILTSMPPAVAGVFAPRLDTESAAGVRAAVDAAVAAYGADGVLVVFDIDNTVLATDDDIASEHWFQWQSARINAGDFTTGTAARTVDDLLIAQGWLLGMARMHATDPALPEHVRQLAQQGVHFMALTSRGLDVRDATLRELERNGLELAAYAPGPEGGYAGRYVPDLSVLSADERSRFAPNGAKPVVFERGVMLTSGQHKGAMLRTLLAKTHAAVRAVVFVDDREHHLDGVEAALASQDIGVQTVRFHHESPRIDAFNASDKGAVTAQWCAFARAALATAATVPVLGCAPSK